jgi:hypothetical protein
VYGTLLLVPCAVVSSLTFESAGAGVASFTPPSCPCGLGRNPEGAGTVSCDAGRLDFAASDHVPITPITRIATADSVAREATTCRARTCTTVPFGIDRTKTGA